MVGQSKSVPEGISVRFRAYIEQLRDFFQSREVHFGSPADLVAFAARVNEPGPFQDEMGSMVRSILFQENDNLGRGELLELLTVAVGGPGIGTGAQDAHASVRQIFSFVNGALSQRKRMFSAEFRADDEHVTAGDVLAAATAQKKAGGQKVAGRSPEDDFYGRTAEVQHAESAAADERRNRHRSETGSGGMLFRAVSMSDADEADESMRAWQGSRRRWMLPVIAAVVLALAVAAYFARPLFNRVGGHGAATNGATLAGPAAVAGTCAGPLAPGTSRSGLAERSRWAHRLLDQKLYDAALPELKSIAQLDPGFPGVNLDESEALLHLRRPEDAREAVDTQIGISECMAKMPSAALDSYCSAEFSPAAAGACRPELSRIRQAAQLQAAMVHLELGHQIGPDTDAAAPELTKDAAPAATNAAPARVSAGTVSSAAVRPRRVASPPATEGDTQRPVQQKVASAKAAAKPGRKAEGDESLIKGDGTDSSLGAYSKPQ